LSNHSSVEKAGLRPLWRYIGGMVVRPRATLDRLAAESTIRWAVLLQALGLLIGWGNVALFALAGQDWLGTKPLLQDPAVITLFGHLRVPLEHYVPFFVVMLPLLLLVGLVLPAAVVQLLSKIWGGRGTFEQMVNTLVFSLGVPELLLASTAELLGSVPANLLSGHPYWWVAAMNGEFGPVVGFLWNFYVIGIYATAQYLWAIALGTIAIRRVQKIPWWAAILTMTIALALWILLVSTLVR